MENDSKCRDTEKKEIYGTYLKEDGTTGYNEKPYSVQLQDYKSDFEGILKAEGVYEFLKDYDIEYRQEFAASQLANKVPRYTRQQYNQSTNRGKHNANTKRIHTKCFESIYGFTTRFIRQ